MNWLDPLCVKIQGLTTYSVDQRHVVSVWATELSGICDLFVPLAPPLQLDHDPVERDIHLCWFWRHMDRSFSIIVDAEARSKLLLLDKQRVQNTDRPGHQRLKTAVQSFFDGWKPQDQTRDI